MQGFYSDVVADADFILLDNISTLCPGAQENDADGWAVMQAWILLLRRQGKSVLLIHHDGKGGQQRGTSKKEDVLDTVISLRRPPDYTADQGCRLEARFTKSRGFYGPDAEPFEARLSGNAWELSDIKSGDDDDTLKTLRKQGSRSGISPTERACPSPRSHAGWGMTNDHPSTPSRSLSHGTSLRRVPRDKTETAGTNGTRGTSGTRTPHRGLSAHGIKGADRPISRTTKNLYNFCSQNQNSGRLASPPSRETPTPSPTGYRRPGRVKALRHRHNLSVLALRNAARGCRFLVFPDRKGALPHGSPPTPHTRALEIPRNSKTG